MPRLFSFMAMHDTHLERSNIQSKTVQCSAYKRGLVYVSIEKLHLVTCEACLKDHYAKVIQENRYR